MDSQAASRIARNSAFHVRAHAFCEHPLFQERGERRGRLFWCPRRSWSRLRPQRPQGNVPEATNSAMKSSWEDEKASRLTGCNAFSASLSSYSISWVAASRRGFRFSRVYELLLLVLHLNIALENDSKSALRMLAC
ncbi:hypothetical protein HMN09_00010700 [Mycena chlorophos]|uniref:Uncharacterized protein n=1 Tax=Mycena chlorophos TaxID=658473 RepID=A0A8H6TV64_MYCCL|nr:hypothetical protein HMN09_00010700 [Mycena chlorophos]